jgi:hypothetical protein
MSDIIILLFPFSMLKSEGDPTLGWSTQASNCQKQMQIVLCTSWLAKTLAKFSGTVKIRLAAGFLHKIRALQQLL